MTPLITLDFESFYGAGYTLSSQAWTTESYIRAPQFETILVGVKVGAEPSYWVPRDMVKLTLDSLHLQECAVISHHAHFDMAILNWIYGIRPGKIIDTLAMARALYGANGGLALAKLAEREGIGQKGDEVYNARGMRFNDFTPQGLAKYGAYCCNDCDLEYALAMKYLPQFSRSELQLIDMVTRMFTEPVFELDAGMLRQYANFLRAEKTALMLRAGVQTEDLMSNDKFAAILLERGVEPPMKVSPAWMKKTSEEIAAIRLKNPEADGMTYAFAKTDAGMQALQEHPDEEIQILVEARLKNKTTIAEKGAERLIGMSERGHAPVYLKYSGASGSHRFSGGDRFNWQSMKRGSDLRNATMAPEGHVCVVGDSSNIESRLLDWLAGQDDMVQVYIDADNKVGPDMYCVVGGRIYKREIDKERDPQERQMGKVAKLGLGYGMGAQKFVSAVRGQAKGPDGKPLVITLPFSKNVVDIYRSSHPQVVKLWKRGEEALKAIAAGRLDMGVDFRGIVRTCKDGLVMPGGLKILYPELRFEKNNGAFGGEWTFWNGKTREHIYGAKVIENIVQCLARIIVMEQCRRAAVENKDIAKWAHSVHDEGVFVTHAFYGPYMKERLVAHMRTPLPWCETLPLNAEAGFHRRYGKAKK